MSDRRLKYLFLVQGEGRGHMTQAISLFHLLTNAGHQVTHVFVGKSKRRQIPEYFTKNIHCPVEQIASPNFVTDPNNKSVRLGASLIFNLKYLRVYYTSMRRIQQKVEDDKIDVVVNFYDFLGGIYYILFKPKAILVSVAHQYLAAHPEFEFAKGPWLDKFLLRLNNRLTAWGAKRRLALSFMEYQPDSIKKLTVVPPLLRQEIFELKIASDGFILGYMVNDGYAEEVMQWHNTHRDVVVHCFWDRKGYPEEWECRKNLTFHQLNDKKFLSMMASCKGYISTAGFESICEAMYLQKPVLMIPVSGQYEQACNAIDAQKAGAGISDEAFNISRLLEFIPQYHRNGENGFGSWLKQIEKRILPELTSEIFKV